MPPFALVAAAWSTAFLTWLARWGYAGVALGVFLESVGVPVPGETALFAAAFGAACGALALPWMIGTAAIASVLGDNLGFALGRRLGRGWLEHHGRRVLFTPERLAQVDRFFARHGPVAVALAVTLSYVLARQGLTGWWTLAVVVLFSALVGVSRIGLESL